jgi:hypothetical protein
MTLKKLANTCDNPSLKIADSWGLEPCRFHYVSVQPVSNWGLDIDSAAITQAGGWKSPRMPLKYAEKINAAR